MKKNIIILTVVVILVIIASLVWYFTMPKFSGQLNPSPSVEASSTPSPSPSPSPTSGASIQIKTEGNVGSLLICSDQCGDGICQKTDPNCKNGNLNCICPETKDNCSQDCK